MCIIGRRSGISCWHVCIKYIAHVFNLDGFSTCKTQGIAYMGNKAEYRQTMPDCFKENYPSTRVIMDCTELFLEQPSSLRSQSMTYSNYKRHNTAKDLIGIAPSSAIKFVSDLYAERMSDRKITKKCGILECVEPGDTKMADRGFDLEDELPNGVELNIPPFMNGESQLSLFDEKETRRITAVCIHVERAIGMVNNFRILKTTLPISMSADFNKIWIVSCYLSNFLPPV